MKSNIAYLFLTCMLMACGTHSNEQASQLLKKTPQLIASAVNFNPEFDKDFLALFNNASLPYQGDTTYALQDTIPAEIAIKYILEAAQTLDPDIFKDIWGDEETQALTRQGLKDRYIDVAHNAFAVINFGAGVQIPISQNYHSVVFHYIPTFMDGKYKFSFLANYTKDGKLIDVLKIGELTQFVDMENTQSFSVSEEGQLKVNTHLVRFGQMYDHAEDYEESGEQIFDIDEKGKFKLNTEQYSSFSGAFLAKTNSTQTAPRFLIEQIFDDFVIRYQATADTAPQEWELVKVDSKKNQVIARKPGTNQEYVLSYDEAKATFTCKNAKGEVASYTRFRQ